VPAGAIPKDGPSAGVAMFTAIVSLLTKRPCRSDVAMTGEITLRGLVLPIGGLKEKALAAHRAGIKTIIIPQRNKKDLVEIPAEVRKQIKFVPVRTVDEVLKTALAPKGRRRSHGGARPKAVRRASQPIRAKRTVKQSTKPTAKPPVKTVAPGKPKKTASKPPEKPKTGRHTPVGKTARRHAKTIRPRKAGHGTPKVVTLAAGRRKRAAGAATTA
jgi:hypothetical protein